MQGSPGNPFLSIIRQEAVEKELDFKISLLKVVRATSAPTRDIGSIPTTDGDTFHPYRWPQMDGDAYHITAS